MTFASNMQTGLQARVEDFVLHCPQVHFLTKCARKLRQPVLSHGFRESAPEYLSRRVDRGAGIHALAWCISWHVCGLSPSDCDWLRQTTALPSERCKVVFDCLERRGAQSLRNTRCQTSSSRQYGFWVLDELDYFVQMSCYVRFVSWI